MAVLLAPAYGGQSQLIVGARPAPPKGDGPGQLVTWQTGDNATHRASFGEPGTPAGNSFYVALDPVHQRLYVPTVAGHTYIFDAADLSFIGSMTSVPGGRVAQVSPDGAVLVVASGKHGRLFDRQP